MAVAAVVWLWQRVAVAVAVEVAVARAGAWAVAGEDTVAASAAVGGWWRGRMRVAALVAAAASVLQQCAAQCTLPAELPPDTVLATTNPGECVLSGDIGDGTECAIQCVEGQAQGDGGYSYICAGTDLTEPTPACTPCPENTYGDTPGLVTCTPCPENSGTDGAVAQTTVTSCLCDAGYENELTTPASTCDACAVGTWLGEVGPGPCTPCTENAVTPGAIQKRHTLAVTRACSSVGAAGSPCEPNVHHMRNGSACLQMWVRQPSQTACVTPGTRVTSRLRNLRAMPARWRRTRKAQARTPAWAVR